MLFNLDKNKASITMDNLEAIRISENQVLDKNEEFSTRKICKVKGTKKLPYQQKNINVTELKIHGSTEDLSTFKESDKAKLNLIEQQPGLDIQFNELLTNVKEIKSEKAELKRASSDLIPIEAKTINEIMISTKEGEFKSRLPKKDFSLQDLVLQCSFEIKENIPLVKEQNLDAKKKASEFVASLNLETNKSQILIDSKVSSEREERLQPKKPLKTNRLRAKIISKETISVQEIDVNIKEQDFKQEQLNFEKLEREIIPHYALCTQHQNVNEKERLRQEEKAKTDLADRSVDEQHALQIQSTNEQIDLAKFSASKIDEKSVNISLQSTKHLAQEEKTLLELESTFDTCKSSSYLAKKDLIIGKPINESLNITNLEKENLFKLDVLTKNKAKSALSDQQYRPFEINELNLNDSVKKLKQEDLKADNASVQLADNTPLAINQQEILESNFDFNILPLNEQKSKIENILKKQRSLSVERKTVLDKEDQLKMESSQYFEASGSIELQEMTSTSQNELLENEVRFKSDLPKGKKAITKLNDLFSNPFIVNDLTSTGQSVKRLKHDLVPDQHHARLSTVISDSLKTKLTVTKVDLDKISNSSVSDKQSSVVSRLCLAESKLQEIKQPTSETVNDLIIEKDLKNLNSDQQINEQNSLQILKPLLLEQTSDLKQFEKQPKESQISLVQQRSVASKSQENIYDLEDQLKIEDLNETKANASLIQNLSKTINEVLPTDSENLLSSLLKSDQKANQSLIEQKPMQISMQFVNENIESTPKLKKKKKQEANASLITSECIEIAQTLTNFSEKKLKMPKVNENKISFKLTGDKNVPIGQQETCLEKEDDLFVDALHDDQVDSTKIQEIQQVAQCYQTQPINLEKRLNIRKIEKDAAKLDLNDFKHQSVLVSSLITDESLGVLLEDRQELKHSKLDLLENQCIQVSLSDTVDKEKHFNKQTLDAKNAKSSLELRKNRSLSVERAQTLNKEQKLDLIDKNEQNLICDLVQRESTYLLEDNMPLDKEKQLHSDSVTLKTCKQELVFGSKSKNINDLITGETSSMLDEQIKPFEQKATKKIAPRKFESSSSIRIGEIVCDLIEQDNLKLNNIEYDQLDQTESESITFGSEIFEEDDQLVVKNLITKKKKKKIDKINEDNQTKIKLKKKPSSSSSEKEEEDEEITSLQVSLSKRKKEKVTKPISKPIYDQLEEEDATLEKTIKSRKITTESIQNEVDISLRPKQIVKFDSTQTTETSDILLEKQPVEEVNLTLTTGLVNERPFNLEERTEFKLGKKIYSIIFKTPLLTIEAKPTIEEEISLTLSDGLVTQKPAEIKEEFKFGKKIYTVIFETPLLITQAKPSLIDDFLFDESVITDQMITTKQKIQIEEVNFELTTDLVSERPFDLEERTEFKLGKKIYSIVFKTPLLITECHKKINKKSLEQTKLTISTKEDEYQPRSITIESVENEVDVRLRPKQDIKFDSTKKTETSEISIDKPKEEEETTQVDQQFTFKPSKKEYKHTFEKEGDKISTVQNEPTTTTTDQQTTITIETKKKKRDKEQEESEIEKKPSYEQQQPDITLDSSLADTTTSMPEEINLILSTEIIQKPTEIEEEEHIVRYGRKLFKITCKSPLLLTEAKPDQSLIEEGTISKDVKLKRRPTAKRLSIKTKESYLIKSEDQSLEEDYKDETPISEISLRRYGDQSTSDLLDELSSLKPSIELSSSKTIQKKKKITFKTNEIYTEAKPMDVQTDSNELALNVDVLERPVILTKTKEIKDVISAIDQKTSELIMPLEQIEEIPSDLQESIEEKFIEEKPIKQLRRKKSKVEDKFDLKTPASAKKRDLIEETDTTISLDTSIVIKKKQQIEEISYLNEKNKLNVKTAKFDRLLSDELSEQFETEKESAKIAKMSFNPNLPLKLFENMPLERPEDLKKGTVLKQKVKVKSSLITKEGIQVSSATSIDQIDQLEEFKSIKQNAKLDLYQNRHQLIEINDLVLSENAEEFKKLKPIASKAQDRQTLSKKQSISMEFISSFVKEDNLEKMDVPKEQASSRLEESQLAHQSLQKSLENEIDLSIKDLPSGNVAKVKFNVVSSKNNVKNEQILLECESLLKSTSSPLSHIASTTKSKNEFKSLEDLQFEKTEASFKLNRSKDNLIDQKFENVDDLLLDKASKKKIKPKISSLNKSFSIEEIYANSNLKDLKECQDNRLAKIDLIKNSSINIGDNRLLDNIKNIDQIDLTTKKNQANLDLVLATSATMSTLVQHQQTSIDNLNIETDLTNANLTVIINSDNVNISQNLSLDKEQSFSCDKLDKNLKSKKQLISQLPIASTSSQKSLDVLRPIDFTFKKSKLKQTKIESIKNSLEINLNESLQLADCFKQDDLTKSKANRSLTTLEQQPMQSESIVLESVSEKVVKKPLSSKKAKKTSSLNKLNSVSIVKQLSLQKESLISKIDLDSRNANESIDLERSLNSNEIVTCELENIKKYENIASLSHHSKQSLVKTDFITTVQEEQIFHTSNLISITKPDAQSANLDLITQQSSLINIQQDLQNESAVEQHKFDRIQATFDLTSQHNLTIESKDILETSKTSDFKLNLNAKNVDIHLSADAKNVAEINLQNSLDNLDLDIKSIKKSIKKKIKAKYDKPLKSLNILMANVNEQSTNLELEHRSDRASLNLEKVDKQKALIVDSKIVNESLDELKIDKKLAKKSSKKIADAKFLVQESILVNEIAQNENEQNLREPLRDHALMKGDQINQCLVQQNVVLKEVSQNLLCSNSIRIESSLESIGVIKLPQMQSNLVMEDIGELPKSDVNKIANSTISLIQNEPKQNTEINKQLDQAKNFDVRMPKEQQIKIGLCKELDSIQITQIQPEELIENKLFEDTNLLAKNVDNVDITQQQSVLTEDKLQLETSMQLKLDNLKMEKGETSLASNITISNLELKALDSELPFNEADRLLVSKNAIENLERNKHKNVNEIIIGQKEAELFVHPLPVEHKIKIRTMPNYLKNIDSEFEQSLEFVDDDLNIIKLKKIKKTKKLINDDQLNNDNLDRMDINLQSKKIKSFKLESDLNSTSLPIDVKFDSLEKQQFAVESIDKIPEFSEQKIISDSIKSDKKLEKQKDLDKTVKKDKMKKINKKPESKQLVSDLVVTEKNLNHLDQIKDKITIQSQFDLIKVDEKLELGQQILSDSIKTDKKFDKQKDLDQKPESIQLISDLVVIEKKLEQFKDKIVDKISSQSEFDFIKVDEKLELGQQKDVVDEKIESIQLDSDLVITDKNLDKPEELDKIIINKDKKKLESSQIETGLVKRTKKSFKKPREKLADTDQLITDQQPKDEIDVLSSKSELTSDETNDLNTIKTSKLIKKKKSIKSVNLKSDQILTQTNLPGSVDLNEQLNEQDSKSTTIKLKKKKVTKSLDKIFTIEIKSKDVYEEEILSDLKDEDKLELLKEKPVVKKEEEIRPKDKLNQKEFTQTTTKILKDVQEEEKPVEASVKFDLTDEEQIIEKDLDDQLIEQESKSTTIKLKRKKVAKSLDKIKDTELKDKSTIDDKLIHTSIDITLEDVQTNAKLDEIKKITELKPEDLIEKDIDLKEILIEEEIKDKILKFSTTLDSNKVYIERRPSIESFTINTIQPSEIKESILLDLKEIQPIPLREIQKEGKLVLKEQTTTDLEKVEIDLEDVYSEGKILQEHKELKDSQDQIDQIGKTTKDKLQIIEDFKLKDSPKKEIILIDLKEEKDKQLSKNQLQQLENIQIQLENIYTEGKPILKKEQLQELNEIKIQLKNVCEEGKPISTIDLLKLNEIQIQSEDTFTKRKPILENQLQQLENIQIQLENIYTEGKPILKKEQLQELNEIKIQLKNVCEEGKPISTIDLLKLNEIQIQLENIYTEGKPILKKEQLQELNEIKIQLKNVCEEGKPISTIDLLKLNEIQIQLENIYTEGKPILKKEQLQELNEIKIQLKNVCEEGKPISTIDLLKLKEIQIQLEDTFTKRKPILENQLQQFENIQIQLENIYTDGKPILKKDQLQELNEIKIQLKNVYEEGKPISTIDLLKLNEIQIQLEDKFTKRKPILEDNLQKLSKKIQDQLRNIYTESKLILEEQPQISQDEIKQIELAKIELDQTTEIKSQNVYEEGIPRDLEDKLKLDRKEKEEKPIDLSLKIVLIDEAQLVKKGLDEQLVEQDIKSKTTKLKKKVKEEDIQSKDRPKIQEKLIQSFEIKLEDVNTILKLDQKEKEEMPFEASVKIGLIDKEQLIKKRFRRSIN